MKIRKMPRRVKTTTAAGAVVVALGLLVAVPTTVAAWNSTATFDAGVRTGTVALLGSTDGVTWVDGTKIPIPDFDLEGDMTSVIPLQIKNGGTKTMRITSAKLTLAGDIFSGDQPASVAIDDADLTGLQLVPGQRETVTVTVKTPADWSSAYMGKTSTLSLAVQGESSMTVCSPVTGVVAGPAPDLSGPEKIAGVSLPNYPQSSVVVAAITSLAGRKMNGALVVDNIGTTSYQSPIGAIQSGASHGMVTTVALQLRNGSSPANDPLFSLAKIAAGDHDAAICRFARDTAAAGRPVIVRVLAEFNNSAFPWGAGQNGNTEADFRAAFRHTSDIFDQAGASNAAIAWSPGSTKLSAVNLASYYPGDRYVDVVGATVFSSANSASASEVYDHTIGSIRAVTKKPIMLSETAALAGTHKAAFIASMFGYLNANGDVIGFNWSQTGLPYAIETGSAEETAFRTGLAAIQLKAFAAVPLH